MAQLMDAEMNLLDKKGREYHDKDNVFANFERVAEKLGLTREEVLLVYMSKHEDSIMKMIQAVKKNDKEYFNNLSEDYKGRFIDIRNYYAILAAMITEYVEG